MGEEVYKKADKKMTNKNFMSSRIGRGVAHCTKVDTDSFCIDLEFMLMMMAPVENCPSIFKHLSKCQFNSSRYCSAQYTGRNCSVTATAVVLRGRRVD